MNKHQLVLRMRGPATENDDVRLDDFIAQLGYVKSALFATAKALLWDDNFVVIRVVDLSRNSPSTVVLEATYETEIETDSELFQQFRSSVSAIQRGGKVPVNLGEYGFEAYRKLSRLLQSNRLAEFAIGEGGSEVTIDSSFTNKIDAILGPIEYEYGTVVGLLQQLNLHAEPPVFTVYPTSRQPSVKCYFPQTLREQIVAAVDKYVEVEGLLEYRSNAFHAHKATITSIEVYPDEKDLPHLANMRGAAGHLPKGVSSEDFVREIRDEWND